MEEEASQGSHDYINIPKGSPSNISETVFLTTKELPPRAPPSPQPQYDYPPVAVPAFKEDEKTPITSQHIPEYGRQIPAGLEMLTQLEMLILKQRLEHIEGPSGCETKNKYKVRDSQGRDLYSAIKNTSGGCFGSVQGFNLSISDTSDREVMTLSSPFACGSLLPCSLKRVEVYAPPGAKIGSVEQEWSIFKPKFLIKDVQGTTVYRIEGATCQHLICGSNELQVLSRDGGTQVGRISNAWSGLLKDAFPDADNFGISFPMNADANIKAVMMGACFLIGFMYFGKA